MSNNKVRFSAFIQDQKPSIQKMKMVRLLARFDRTHGEVYVKDQQALKDHLNNIIFERELSR